ncbi:protein phosphatase CheZ [Novispirillum sp. DQ9]|uniref:protein phosphatase CheZ n=1 Tax=Novispirillum sp. DQ9 TaxID=3398612 RepID=UPI003C7AB88B
MAAEDRTTSQDGSVAAAVDERIAALRARSGDSVPLDEVASVVRSLLGSLSGDLSPEDVRLYHEVEDLARYIQSAKAEIAALNPADIREEFLPTAADELDAIVQSTEAATGEIMDATEAIEDMVSELPDHAAEAIRAATTRIYEACSFQDITGQRVTKVVRTLKSIEDRVDGLVRAFDPQRHGVSLDSGTVARPLAGAGGGGDRRTVAARGDRPDDAALLNGPQGQGDAIKQDDVDALLAKFD